MFYHRITTKTYQLEHKAKKKKTPQETKTYKNKTKNTNKLTFL